MRSTKFRLQRYSGFTLLEVLTVVLIIGVTLTFVTVNLSPDAKSQLNSETKQLAMLLELVSEEAAVTGEYIGWSIDNESFQFWRLSKKDKWIKRDSIGLLRSGSLKNDIEAVSLEINGRKERLKSRIVFSPSGYNPPFIISLTVKGQKAKLKANPIGKIYVEEAI